MFDPKFIGKTYPPRRYVVGIEKIKEYTFATDERHPLCTKPEVAKDGPYGEIVAPPMFAVVYQKQMMGDMLLDKDLSLNVMMLVHGEQEFIFHKLVKHNDEVITTGKLLGAEAKKGNLIVKFELDSSVDGEPVTTGFFTVLIRGGAA